MAIQAEMKFPIELQYGDFGCADPEVEKRTEPKKYNVKIQPQRFIYIDSLIQGIPFVMRKL